MKLDTTPKDMNYKYNSNKNKNDIHFGRETLLI